MQFEELRQTGSLKLGSLDSSFLNLLFWTIYMSQVNKNKVWIFIVQLRGKLFTLSKTSLVSNVFINYLCLNILDCTVSVNVYNAEICSVLLNFVGKFFFTVLSFTIFLMPIMSMPAFSKWNFMNLFGLVLVAFDTGGL